MANFLEGLRIEGSSTASPTITANMWQELARFKVASGTPSSVVVRGLNSATSGTFTEKDHLMVLFYDETTADYRNKIQFNSDTGDTNNYAQKYLRSSSSSPYGSVSDENSLDYFKTGSWSWTGNDFSVWTIMNKASTPKLMMYRGTKRNEASNTNPWASQIVGQWTNNDRINMITITKENSSGSQNFVANTECVVLGYSNGDSGGSNTFWECLADEKITSSTTSKVVSFTAKHYLMVQVECVATSSGNINMQFNSNTGNYAVWENTGGTYAHNVSQTNTDNLSGTSTGTQYCTIFIANPSTQKKLWINEGVSIETNGTSANADTKRTHGKWYDNTQVSSIKVNANFGDGSRITVWGAN